MIKIKLYSLILLLMVSITGISKSQIQKEDMRWSNTAIYPLGNYEPLPQKIVPFVHSSTPRIIKTPYEVLVVNPNIQVLPSPGCTQTELPLVSSKVNPNFMFGSSNAVQGSSINSGSYITTDGGTTWSGYNYINNGNTSNQRGDPGPVIDKDQRVIFTHLASASNFGNVIGMAAEYSTNYGQNFSTSYQIDNYGSSDDKNLAGTDDNPGSPYYGYSYIAWCNYVAGTSYVARTTNGGVSWGSPVSWSAPGGSIAQGHDVAVTPNGTVIVCYALHPSSGLVETGIGIGRSTDGGQTFTPNAPAFSINGIRSNNNIGPFSIRVNSFPRIAIDKSGGPRNGWIYVVTTSVNMAPAGSTPDIVMFRSTNDGVSWSAGIRVNQDPLNQNKYHWFSCVCVDNNGGVNVAYYDSRNFPNGDSASVFISRSLDGGNTWTDVEVADHHFTPKPCQGLGGNYMGDYIGCAAGNGKVWAFWMDDKPYYAGFFQAWAGWIQGGPPIAHHIPVGPFLHLPNSFITYSNYNIVTQIRNTGTSNETNVPIKWFINGQLVNTTYKNLNSGQIDSVSNNWTPTAAGSYTLMYCSALTTDTTNRIEDTVRTTVSVSALPSLCESFESTNWPPTGWTISGPGAAYWERVRYGYHSTWSAYYDNFHARAGDIGDLTTFAFPPTQSPTDSLHFALAFCKKDTSNDELAIYASTNSGTNFTLVHIMTAAEMQTVSSCSHPFQPSGPSQWGTKAFGVPVGTNMIRLEGISDNGDGVYIDSIGFASSCWVIGINNQTQEIPKDYSLSQNYPNPFNPSTMIKFALPKAGEVKLVVYDIRGSEIATLVNTRMGVGTHTITFNGENLASGVYLYKVETNDFTAIKKMVLLK